jgi:GTPase SAR1 family protein
VDNAVQAILQDDEGDLWFGIDAGVSRYDGASWQSFITENSGLAHNVVQAILQDREGNLWFGTDDGVSRHIVGTVPPIIVHLKLITTGGQVYTPTDQLTLPYSQRDLTFEFVGRDLKTDREDLRYVYKLEGHNPDWQATANPFEETARYFDLPSGTYTFVVQARDMDFNYSEPASLGITIEPLSPTPTPIIVVRPTLPPEVIEPTVTLPFLGSVSQTAIYGGSTVSLLLLGLSYVAIAHWQANRRTRQAIERKFNPYISGDPIREPDMFFGREELLRKIINTLHNNSIMIHGPRRIGKTSLLYQLANRLRAASDPDYAFIPALIDLEGTAQEEFFHTLVEEILEDCQPYLTERLSLAYNEKSQRAYTHRDFARDLSTLIDQLQQSSNKEVRLILLLDEVDVMNRYDQLVQQQLRRIFMKTFARNLGAVVAGVHISKEWERLESPWYNLFLEMELSPLSREEAVRLIKEPVKGVYSYEDEAVEAIWEYSQGHPQLVQQLCLEAVNRLLQEKRSRVTRADVESVYREIAAWEKVQEGQGERERPPPLVKRVAEEGPTYEAEEGTDV